MTAPQKKPPLDKVDALKAEADRLYLAWVGCAFGESRTTWALYRAAHMAYLNAMRAEADLPPLTKEQTP